MTRAEQGFDRIRDSVVVLFEAVYRILDSDWGTLADIVALSTKTLARGARTCHPVRRRRATVCTAQPFRVTLAAHINPFNPGFTAAFGAFAAAVGAETFATGRTIGSRDTLYLSGGGVEEVVE